MDVKSKQYHSLYHKERVLQQFVDKKPLEDYLVYALARGLPLLLLFHLWPDQAMHAFGHGDMARIHTGLAHEPLAETLLQDVVQRYPVDDAYYLVNAQKILLHGRLDVNRWTAGY